MFSDDGAPGNRDCRSCAPRDSRNAPDQGRSPPSARRAPQSRKAPWVRVQPGPIFPPPGLPGRSAARRNGRSPQQKSPAKAGQVVSAHEGAPTEGHRGFYPSKEGMRSQSQAKPCPPVRRGGVSEAFQAVRLERRDIRGYGVGPHPDNAGFAVSDQMLPSSPGPCKKAPPERG